MRAREAQQRVIDAVEAVLARGPVGKSDFYVNGFETEEARLAEMYDGGDLARDIRAAMAEALEPEGGEIDHDSVERRALRALEPQREAFARRNGYFFLPCPLCGLRFGGHEWAHDPDVKSAIRTGLNSGTGICPACTDEGRGDF